MKGGGSRPGSILERYKTHVIRIKTWLSHYWVAGLQRIDDLSDKQLFLETNKIRDWSHSQLKKKNTFVYAFISPHSKYTNLIKYILLYTRKLWLLNPRVNVVLHRFVSILVHLCTVKRSLLPLIFIKLYCVNEKIVYLKYIKYLLQYLQNTI